MTSSFSTVLGQIFMTSAKVEERRNLNNVIVNILLLNKPQKCTVIILLYSDSITHSIVCYKYCTNYVWFESRKIEIK